MRTWVRPAACLLLLTALLAGCTGGRDGEGRGPSDEGDLASAHPFSVFLCRGGLRVPADVGGGDVDACNHRVTKPLLDPNWFNVVDQHGPGNEVSIAVNPEDPRIVAAGAKDYTVSYVSHDARCGAYTVWMGTYWSSDGGITWGNDLMPGFAGDPRDSPLKGNLCNTDPVLLWDEDSRQFFYSGLNYIGSRADEGLGTPNPLYPGSSDLMTGSQLYFATSDDGSSYGNFSFAGNGDDGVAFNDKQWFAAQPDGLHMIATWSQFYSSPPVPGTLPPALANQLALGTDHIVYSESFDGGRTWSPQRFFTAGTAMPVNSQFSMPVYLPASQERDIAVIWSDDADGLLPGDPQDFQPEHLAYTEAVLTPQGAVFAPTMSGFDMNPMKSAPGRDGTGPSQFRMGTYPVLAVDRSGGEHDGRRYVVWADQPGPVDTDVQVLLRWSDDGATWSEPVTVNDAAVGDQFMPWIDVDASGGVHVAWYDRRNDATNLLIDIYYAYSDTGGEGFHPNVRVTETSFDGDLGHHQTGAPFIGDYMGLDATNSTAHILWADTRHTGEAGREAGSDVYTATLLRDASAGRLFD